MITHMTKSETAMREAFEKWYKDYFKVDRVGKYSKDVWDAYQAAIASLSTVTEAELVDLIAATWTKDIDMSFSQCVSQTARTLAARFPHLITNEAEG